MHSSFIKYFEKRARVDLAFLMQQGFEIAVKPKDNEECWIGFRNESNAIHLRIAMFFYSNQLSFTGYLSNEKKYAEQQTIDLTLLIPYYYGISMDDFKKITTPDNVEAAAKELLDVLFPFFTQPPLIEILLGRKWLNGFFWHPHDQVAGVPWSPPKREEV